MPSGVYKRSQKQLMFLKKLAKRPRTFRGGGYHAIHKWLIKNFGKANKCEQLDCKKTSKCYQYALLKNKKYEHKRENFRMMCASCHRLYDQKPEWIEKAAQKKRGIKLTDEHKIKISNSMKGKNLGNQNARKYYEN